MPSEVTYQLGHTIIYKGQQARVVRIIQHSDSLHDPEDGKPSFIQHESYVELKLEDGTLDFITLFQEREPYQGPPSTIKAPEPIWWEGVQQ